MSGGCLVVFPFLEMMINLKRSNNTWPFVVEAGKTSTLQPPTISSFKWREGLK